MRLTSPLLFRLFGCQIGSGSALALRSLRGARAKGVSIGANSILACRFSLDRPTAKIAIGNRCYIGASHLVAAESITIEDDVIVSWGVTVVDHNSHALDWADRSNDVTDWQRGAKDWSKVVSRPVVLKQRCWIGFNVAILKGVTIGEGAIVGACSVVTKDVPPYTVVAGNPARVIKEVKRTDG